MSFDFLHINMAQALSDLFLSARIFAAIGDPRRPKETGCTPKPAPKDHPGRNPLYNGMGRRYFQRSRYVPHQGAKEVARRLLQDSKVSRRHRQRIARINAGVAAFERSLARHHDYAPEAQR